jgi:hypothetical protein
VSLKIKINELSALNQIFFDIFPKKGEFLLFTKISGIKCQEFRLHNDSVESLLTRGLSPLPVCVLDNI